MAFLLDRQMSLPSLQASHRRLVVSVIEEYHGPIVAVSAETSKQVQMYATVVSPALVLWIAHPVLKAVKFLVSLH